MNSVSNKATVVKVKWNRLHMGARILKYDTSESECGCSAR